MSKLSIGLIGVNGRSRMDVKTFFDRIRQNLTDLMNREQTDVDSARVQRTAWIRFSVEVEDENGNVIGVDRVRLPFSTRMTEIFKGSDLNKIVNEMFTHIKTQIQNPALANSRFRFDEVLFLDVNFCQLNLAQGSSFLPLPDRMSAKKAVTYPKNENDEECFKRAVTAALHHLEIKSHAERISHLGKYVNNYDWSELKFPLAIKNIDKFEKNSDISINVLGINGKDIHIQRKSKYDVRKKVVLHLLLTADGERRHYTAIKSLTRVLRSSNSKHKCKQHFCMNCLQGFSREESRDKHFEYCKDNETVRIKMPKRGSVMKFHDGQNQFKVLFVMYADFEAILKQIEVPKPNPEESYTQVINQHIPSGFCMYGKFAYGTVKNPLKLYRAV